MALMAAIGMASQTAPTLGSQRFVHPQAGYSITPPAGFKLQQVGRRTIWQGPNGAQVLVETGAPSGSPRRSWERLSAALAQKYGRRYRLLNIRDARLSGYPVAVWVFEIGDIRKADVGLAHRGRGYAILVSAPRSRFRAWQPHFEATLRSFTLPGAPPSAKPPVVKRPAAQPVAPKPVAKKPLTPRLSAPTPRPSPQSPKSSDDMISGY